MIDKSQDAIYDTLSNTGDLCRQWWAFGRYDAFNHMVSRLIVRFHYGAGEAVIEAAVKEVIAYWRDNATDYVIGGSYDGTTTEFVAQFEPDGGALVLTSDLASAVRMPLETARSFILDNGLNRFSIFIHNAGGVRVVTNADMI